jgi:hypothetical protein
MTLDSVCVSGWYLTLFLLIPDFFISAFWWYLTLCQCILILSGSLLMDFDDTGLCQCILMTLDSLIVHLVKFFHFHDTWTSVGAFWLYLTLFKYILMTMGFVSILWWSGSYLCMGHRGPGPGRQIYRGSILKKIEIGVWYAEEKKAVHEREKCESLSVHFGDTWLFISAFWWYLTFYQ